MKTSLLITNDHRDVTGGGTYVMMILYILRDHFNLYTDRDVDYYSRNNTPWKLNPGEMQQADISFVPDIHLYASYGGWVAPQGKKNIQITYFPQDKNIAGWDNFFVLNDFCADAFRRTWNIEGSIITPYFDESAYYSAEKKNTVINIGQYFYEQDGHSKNQHLIIEWFKNQDTANKLICHGMITNAQYYDQLCKMAGDDPRIEIKGNSTQEEIRQDLAEAKYMIHAIGYNRTAPAQVEHFGLVAVEALLSGCQPIVHNSGGCKDIPGVITYTEFNEIVLLDTDPIKIREFGLRFNIKNTEQEILKAING
jgi:glycosyltransferase involved in cell wall biosynthesis